MRQTAATPYNRLNSLHVYIKSGQTCMRINFLIICHAMLINVMDVYLLQGSSAFVYGWTYFADRLSNGIVNNIILRIDIKE